MDKEEKIERAIIDFLRKKGNHQANKHTIRNAVQGRIGRRNMTKGKVEARLKYLTNKGILVYNKKASGHMYRPSDELLQEWRERKEEKMAANENK